MQDYNLWQNLLGTYRSLPTWLKGIWLIIPPAFLLALIWLFRRSPAGAADTIDGTIDGTIADTIDSELLYTVCREPGHPHLSARFG